MHHRLFCLYVADPRTSRHPIQGHLGLLLYISTIHGNGWMGPSSYMERRRSHRRPHSTPSSNTSAKKKPVMTLYERNAPKYGAREYYTQFPVGKLFDRVSA